MSWRIMASSWRLGLQDKIKLRGDALQCYKSQVEENVSKPFHVYKQVKKIEISWNTFLQATYKHIG